VAEALDRIGYRGRHPVGTQKFASFVELHIEQGPILEAETRPSAWSIPARACCGMTARSPASRAMPAPRRCRCAATRWQPCRRSCWRWRASQKKHGPKAVGTVGEAVIASPSRNVIPGEIAFTVDCRSADAGIMDTLDSDLRAAVSEIAGRRKVEVALDLVWRKPPTHFDPKLVDAVENAASRARLFPPPHHVGRRSRCLQSQHRDARRDGVRALQGRRQPQ